MTAILEKLVAVIGALLVLALWAGAVYVLSRILRAAWRWLTWPHTSE